MTNAILPKLFYYIYVQSKADNEQQKRDADRTERIKSRLILHDMQEARTNDNPSDDVAHNERLSEYPHHDAHCDDNKENWAELCKNC